MKTPAELKEKIIKLILESQCDEGMEACSIAYCLGISQKHATNLLFELVDSKQVQVMKVKTLHFPDVEEKLSSPVYCFQLSGAYLAQLDRQMSVVGRYWIA